MVIQVFDYHVFVTACARFKLYYADSVARALFGLRLRLTIDVCLDLFLLGYFDFVEQVVTL